MILTVTPNPSLDLLYEADRLAFDDANRIPEPRRRPGGQGINVARAIRALGGEATAVTLVGGATGRELAAVLQQERTPVLAVEAADATRLFVAVRERESGRSLLLNSPGPERAAADMARLLEAVRQTVERLRPAWVAACGSVPPGFPPDFHARVGRLAREHGARFVPDCDGEALRIAVPADLLVPNRHEAGRLLGDPVGGPASAARAARALVLAGTPLVAVTLGEQGAVLATARGVWHAVAPARDGSGVGAGDAFLAALLLALEAGRLEPDALAAATAAGAAAVASRGLAIVDPGELRPLTRATTVRPIRP